VERLIHQSRTTITLEPADSADVKRCFKRYYAELDHRFDGGFDVARSNRVDIADLTPPSGFVLLARVGDDPVGCGAARLHEDGVAEIKRMWVSPRMRGQGLGGRLLAELERRAAAQGATVARLETNRSLTEAVAMYRRAGYREVTAFNDEPYADHWFEKQLAPAPLDRPRVRMPD
jgi:ribosomal protein S18 acetylase RimI-like enzyme